MHGGFSPIDAGKIRTAPCEEVPVSPEQMRWNPMPIPAEPTDFIAGLVTGATAGNALEQKGVGIHWYVCNRSMVNTFFYTADGELLIVPQEGTLRLRTELGTLEVSPKEIAVIPRGIRFAVETAGPARGYVCENYGAPLRLPGLGPIGANGLAAPRDFLYPTAAFEDRDGDFTLIAKLGGRLWKAPLKHSVFDVVAWHGNYAPYKYDLTRFNTIGTISFDHPDPSIFTVLTSGSDVPGTANLDFVIFPPRWMVANDTFRPPYFHRNTMSEWMGNVHGKYDAKGEGFAPGGASLHNAFTAHGPDQEAFEKATNAELKPTYIDDTLQFMFETRYVLQPTRFALEGGLLQRDYLECWEGLKKHYR